MPIHIEANIGDVAQSVILVGDPDRATFIAENYLENPVCYNRYRHMFGYTGTYKGKKISVQTAGMGSPSISIVLEELNMLGVKNIVRLGTCGTIKAEKVNLGDTVILSAAHSSHDIYAREFPGASFSAVPDFVLTSSLYQAAVGIHGSERVHAGSGLCSETFYEDDYSLYKKFAQYGTLVVEMEAYALFALTAKYNMKSAVILTVSDVIFEKIRADKEVIGESVKRNTQSVLELFSVL
ncbi:MAG: purine-nucleoside phosphorylase [Spirochaetota bacterium]|jgi:purine-nucleoside phosphorylase|nr:purine-nucleoside phosphorylase [Spirochaetota bacterium]